MWHGGWGRGLDLAAEDGSGMNAGPLRPVLMRGGAGAKHVSSPGDTIQAWCKQCVTGSCPAAAGKHSGASRGGEHAGEEGRSDFCHDGQGEDARVFFFFMRSRDLGGSCGPPCRILALAGTSFPRPYKVSAAAGLAADPRIPPGSPYPSLGPCYCTLRGTLPRLQVWVV